MPNKSQMSKSNMSMVLSTWYMLLHDTKYMVLYHGIVLSQIWLPYFVTGTKSISFHTGKFLSTPVTGSQKLITDPPSPPSGKTSSILSIFVEWKSLKLLWVVGWVNILAPYYTKYGKRQYLTNDP